MKKGLALLSAAVLLLSGCDSKKAAVDINEVLGYEGFSVNSVEFQYDAPEYCREIFEEIIGSASLKPVSLSGKTRGTGEYLKFESGGEACKFSIREADDGKKYLYADSGNEAEFFEMDAEKMEELEGQLLWFSPKAFYGEIVEKHSDTAYVVCPDEGFWERNSSDKIFVSSDIPFNVGDRVRVGYYGGIMETYPAQINQLFIKGGNSVEVESSAEDEEAFTNRELEEMEAVRNTVSQWLKGAEGLSLDEKKAEAEKLLLTLSETGTEEFPYSLIIKESIYIPEKGDTISFEHTCGASAGIKLMPFDPMLN